MSTRTENSTPRATCPGPASRFREPCSSESLFWRLGRRAASRILSLWRLLSGILLVVLALGAVLLLAFRRKGLALVSVVAFILVAFILVAFSLFVTTAGHLGMPGDVHVLASARVGVYDTKVIRADDPKALTGWLVERGFQFGPEDEKAFQHYIDRGWKFVAARVTPEATAGKKELTSYDGLLPPLALLFNAPEPVYPWALTATAGHPVELVLYVVAPSRVECSPLGTEFADDRWGIGNLAGIKDNPSTHFEKTPGAFVSWAIGAESDPPAVSFFGARWLTRLHATLGAGDVDGDLVLTLGPETAYRRTLWR